MSVEIPQRAITEQHGSNIDTEERKSQSAKYKVTADFYFNSFVNSSIRDH